MKLSLPNAVTTRYARTLLKAEKNSPQLLFGTGLVLMAGSLVAVGKGTLSLEGTLDDIRRDREDIDRVAEANPEKYGEREVRKLHAYVTFRGAYRVTKLYLPAITLAAASVACLTSAHSTLNRRNAGLSAALAATERALDTYRDRVRESVGEERELKLWRGETTETVDDVDEEGKPTGHKKKVKRGGGYSPYAVLWGKDTSTEWDPESEYNVAKLRSVQEYCTMRLNHKGHLFLNDVYRELGLPDATAGAVVGWLSKDFGGKDGAIDFGVLDPHNATNFVDFMHGVEDHIWLDFNVDGEIWRKIDKKEIQR